MIPPGPRSRQSVQFNWIGHVLLIAQNVTKLISDAGKQCFAGG